MKGGENRIKELTRQMSQNGSEDDEEAELCGWMIRSPQGLGL